MNSDAIEKEVYEYLRGIGVLVQAKYIGETKRDDWQCDAWQIMMTRGVDEKGFRLYSYSGTVNKFETLFYTGLGLRKKSKQRHWLPAVPVAPSTAMVMYSIVHDTEALDQSFVDWCYELGYNSDSIKDRHIYDQCCEIGLNMRKLFSCAEREHLKELLEDY